MLLSEHLFTLSGHVGSFTNNQLTQVYVIFYFNVLKIYTYITVNNIFILEAWSFLYNRHLPLLPHFMSSEVGIYKRKKERS